MTKKKDACPRCECKRLEEENAELRRQLADTRWWEQAGPAIASEAIRKQVYDQYIEVSA